MKIVASDIDSRRWLLKVTDLKVTSLKVTDPDATADLILGQTNPGSTADLHVPNLRSTSVLGVPHVPGHSQMCASTTVYCFKDPGSQ